MTGIPDMHGARSGAGRWRQIPEKAYTVATKWLPSTTAARLDLARPSYRSSWGGPLNGQKARRQIVRDLAKGVTFDRVIETGTYRGASTEFFSAVFGVPVATVEADPRCFAYSRSRLAHDSDVVVELGDSRPFLRALAQQFGPNETVFIYLDAHWADDLPLAEELMVIAGAWPNAVVMIDDFQVLGDAGYGYDDYGSGRGLVEEYLPADTLAGWTLYYPAVDSARETGAKRGSCVLASPAVPGMDDISTLRRGRVF